MTAIDAIAERVAAGAPLGAAEAEAVLASRDLIAIGSMADDLRRRIHGARTTFVRVFEVHVEAVPSSLPSGTAAGEIRVVGQPQTLDAALASVSDARRLASGVPLTGFSLAHLRTLGRMRDVAGRLKEAGLDAVAEVTLDGPVSAQAVGDLRDGGLQAWRITVASYEDVPPVEMVQRAVELQRTAGGFRAFAPLPRVTSALAPTTGYDDVKLVALARLLCADIPSIQVDWPLYGPKLAQVALTMGADDIDGVAAFDPATLGSRRSALAEVTGNIRAASLEPVERNGRFEAAA